ncbi:MAG: cupredoxin domain-containing protein [Thaumarchaeota archaeon]|nr:cupredoxin domain-containing protein [Nitrososphaerota archaeon]
MARRHRKSQGKRFGWLLLLPIGILALLGVWFTLPGSQPATNTPDADVHLLVSMSGWNPEHFEARAGVTVRVMLMTLPEEASHSDNIHSFILKETNTEVYVKAGNSQVFTVVFPSPGTYTFWCLTCCNITSPSPSASFMSGTVTVTQ